MTNYLLYINCISWNSINYFGTKYKTGDYICIKNNNDYALKITEIIIENSSEIYLYCQKSEIEFKRHYSSYGVGSLLNSFKFLKIKDINFPPIIISSSPQGVKFLRPKVTF